MGDGRHEQKALNTLVVTAENSLAKALTSIRPIGATFAVEFITNVVAWQLFPNTRKIVTIFFVLEVYERASFGTSETATYSKLHNFIPPVKMLPLSEAENH